MWIGVVTALAVALAAGVYLIAIAGWVVAAIGAASVLAMLTYVGGPIPYGYRGLGEVFVFVFFGLVATVGTRYVHQQSAPAAAWWLGTAMGALAAASLVANNLRDIETDAATGKRTLAVMLGPGRTRALYATLLIGSFVVLLAGAVASITPPLTGLAITLFFLTGPLIGAVRTRTDGPGLIGVLAGTARLQFLVALVVSVTAAVSAP
jgi:1,4-dihydroxy-2-naphthoate octaprenyltransferase